MFRVIIETGRAHFAQHVDLPLGVGNDAQAHARADEVVLRQGSADCFRGLVRGQPTDLDGPEQFHLEAAVLPHDGVGVQVRLTKDNDLDYVVRLEQVIGIHRRESRCPVVIGSGLGGRSVRRVGHRFSGRVGGGFRRGDLGLEATEREQGP